MCVHWHEDSRVARAAADLASLLDRDGDGELTRQEFQALMALSVVRPSSEEDVANTNAFFDEVDTDRSGEVSLEELCDVFHKAGAGATVSDIGELAYECFQSYRASLGREDFMQLMLYIESRVNQDWGHSCRLF